MTTRRLCRTILARSRSGLSKHPDTYEAVGVALVLAVYVWLVLTSDVRTLFRKPTKPTRADWDRMAKETRARTAAHAKRGLA